MDESVDPHLHISVFAHLNIQVARMNEQQHRMKHLLLIANKDRTSFDVMQQIYKLILTIGDHTKMFSLQSFGKQFQAVIPMQANEKNLKHIDFIIVVGDNQTLMESIRYYNCKDTPAILGVGNGSGLGLYNYLKFQAEQVVQISLNKLLSGSLYTQKLMKLKCNLNCETVAQAVCQLEIHRGMDQSIVILNLYLENQKRQKVKIGNFKGDGLLISTPMGSYCKSLNLNGPLMSKTMQNIMITPICPLSMKFRPLCLPATSRIFIQIAPACRTDYAQIYFDEGGLSAKLHKGELLRVRTSKYKANLVANLQESCEQLFIKGLKNTIRWGQNYQSIQLEQMLSKTSEL